MAHSINLAAEAIVTHLKAEATEYEAVMVGGLHLLSQPTRSCGPSEVLMKCCRTLSKIMGSNHIWDALVIHCQIVLATGPDLDHKNWSVQFQNRPKTRPADSWRAKPGLVPVNPWVSPGLGRPVGYNLQFWVSGFTFMVAFRYATVNRKILTLVRHSSFLMY